MIRKGKNVTEKEIPSRQTADLRMQAENIVRKKTIRMPESPDALSPEETRQAFHELRVHQIELEIQNEELRRAQVELAASRARYFDLYDLAPVGYVTISETGLILEANLTAASLLGTIRGALVNQPFSRLILPEDKDIYYLRRKKLFEVQGTKTAYNSEPQGYELRMIKMDGTVFWVRFETTAAQGTDGRPLCRVVLSDITDRKLVEEALRESEERFKNLYQESPIPTFTWQKNGEDFIFIDFNSAAI